MKGYREGMGRGGGDAYTEAPDCPRCHDPVTECDCNLAEELPDFSQLFIGEKFRYNGKLYMKISYRFAREFGPPTNAAIYHRFKGSELVENSA